jgi:hypothetical protein
MRSRTKKQFSSSWKAYRILTTKGWSIWSMFGGASGMGERSTNLFEQAAFLNDVGDGLHLDAFGFVDVLESIELLCLLVLDNADLGECRISVGGGKPVGFGSGEGSTLPKAPLPTLLRRRKWKRFASPSKSTGWKRNG